MRSGSFVWAEKRRREAPLFLLARVERERGWHVPLVRAVVLEAVDIQVQGMLAHLEAALTRDAILLLFNVGIVELFDATALHAHEVIVMLAVVQLEDRLRRLEVMAFQQPRLFELRKHAIHRRQPYIHVFGHQHAINVLSREVTLIGALKEF